MYSKISTSLLAILCIATSLNSYSQCCSAAIPHNLPLKVATADFIVEGEVIGKESFWNESQTSIFTAYSIATHDVLKGSSMNSTIELILPGGIVGLEGMVVSPNVELRLGQKGIFFLKTEKTESQVINPHSYEMSSWPYGMIKYDPFGDRFIDGMHTIAKSSLNAILEKRPSSSKKGEFFIPFNSPKTTSTITSFSPTTAPGGTQTPITISGSAFGTAQGSIFFANSDDGGMTFIPANAVHIQSWSDTQVVINVPDKAGTGPIAVLPAGATTPLFSTATLTVPYTINTVISDATGTTIEYDLRFVDQNGNGGQTWQMQTDFDNDTPAKEAFLRALDSWRCGPGVNWDIGAPTTTDVIADDDINVVRWDNGTELDGASGGAIGRATSYFSGCFTGPSSIEWYISEVDIVFDFESNWNFGPDLPTNFESDFETVAVHELGHNYQLNHVNDFGSDVMHYVLQDGTDIRDPGANNLTASGIVQSRSETGSACGNPPMTAFVCPASCPADINGDGVVGVDDFLDLNSAYDNVCNSCPEDLTGDGVVNVDDFLDLNSAYGTTCP